MKLPLFVLDRKSKKGGFVIQDLKAYESTANQEEVLKKPFIRGTVAPLDYRALGLLWDQPSMTNEEFHKALKYPASDDHAWVARRFLERVPSRKVTEVLSLDELKEILSHVKLRPIFQEAWRHAVQYWSQTS